MAADDGRVTVYFDGACHLCSREIEHYRKRDAGRRIKYVDISRSSFDAAREGLDPMRVQKELHVRLADGTVRTGVAAFAALWDVLPGYGWLARISRHWLATPVLNASYRAFATVRPYLPKRSGTDGDACATGTCATRH
jgi:predicted DCC family thiol-disulfide oxidoreductase YuxK